ncbi:hypothetical protein AYK24_00605 [Thermoplasmatales archaeon SG8-52-4]|nr:MAG: hypothetical protein AYK24_00605 [Thermoplasmatales archaeon SG8-52-4]
MATEPLEYKVTFDTSEVAQKLSEVKNAMDVAFGAQAFNAAGPDLYPFQQLFSSTALTSLNSMAPVSFGVPEGVSNAMVAAQQGVQMARSTFSDVQNVFNTVAESARLGYSKFTRDLEMTGLMAGRMAGPQPTLSYPEQLQQISNNDYWGNVGGALGFGYKPTMTMSAAEYARRNAEETADKFMEPTWGEAIGLGVGAVAAMGGGPVGWGLLGLTAVPFAAKAALYPFTSELRHQRALESYVSGTSWRFLSGQFNRQETEQMGQFLRGIPDRDNIAARGYGRLEVDETVAAFTEAGGFDYVRNAREYRQKVERLFEGHRELMHTLHITSKEASTLMGRLSRDLGVENFGAFSANVGVLADRAGLTRNEAATFIMQSAELVRGTGYGMENFALGAGRMLENVRNMARAGILSPEDLRQFGGEQNIALNMARSAMNFAGSPMGFVTQAAFMSAQLGGGNLGQVAGMGINAQLNAAAGLFRSPMDFARFFGQQQNLVDQMGPEVAMQQKTMLGIEQAQMLFNRRQFSSNDLYGAFRAMGYSHQESREMVSTRDLAASDAPTRREQDYSRALERLRQMEEEGESPFGRAWRGLGRELEGAIWRPITGAAEDAYIAIEKGYKTAERALGRTFTALTGGIFEVQSSKPTGLMAALTLGKDFTKQYKNLMNLGDADIAELEKSIISNMGDSRLMVDAVHRSLVSIPGVPGIIPMSIDAGTVGVGTLSATDAAREVQGIIENIGKEDRKKYTGRGRASWGASLVNWITGATYTSKEMETISGLAEALGPDFTEESVQSTLAQAFYAADVEYAQAQKAGKLKKGMTREEFIRGRVTTYLEPIREKLGGDNLENLNRFVQTASSELISALSGQGMAENREERDKFQMTLKTAAEDRIMAEKGITRDKITEDMLREELKTTTFDDAIAALIGEKTGTMQGRQDAAAVFRQRLGATAIAGQALFTIKDDQGTPIFDQNTAQMIQATNSQLIANGITRMTSGQLSDAEAIPVKMIKN